MSDDLRTLDIEIAKALGYRLEKLATGGYRLHGTEGESYFFPEKFAYDDESAERVMVLNIPEFTTDANAALSLVAKLPVNVASAPNYGWGNERKTWRCEIPAEGSKPHYEDTLSLAICRAWLAWKRVSTAADDVHS